MYQLPDPEVNKHYIGTDFMVTFYGFVVSKK